MSDHEPVSLDGAQVVNDPDTGLPPAEWHDSGILDGEVYVRKPDKHGISLLMSVFGAINEGEDFSSKKCAVLFSKCLVEPDPSDFNDFDHDEWTEEAIDDLDPTMTFGFVTDILDASGMDESVAAEDDEGK